MRCMVDFKKVINRCVYTVLLFAIIGRVDGYCQVTVSGHDVLVDGSVYQIRGVCYSPHAVGAQAWEFDFSQIDKDIQLMQEACVNTIRTYQPVLGQSELDKFYQAGIRVIVGFTLEETRGGSYSNYISTFKNHPAILMWAHGNEFNYHPDWFTNGNIYDWYGILNQEAANTKALDSKHPVATVHGELPDAGALNACPNVDVWGLNIYRKDILGPLFSDFANRSSKPMFIGESGADSYPDANAPVLANPKIYQSVSDNGTWKNGSQVCSGICFFEWTDEWWKSGNVGVQDLGGFSNIGVAYDEFAHEEYWGILDVYHNKKPAFNALKSSFCNDLHDVSSGFVQLFGDCDFNGAKLNLLEGEYLANQLGAVGNNQVSSIQVLPGYAVALYDRDNFQGNELIITEDDGCLVNNSFNDSASSIKVFPLGESGLSEAFSIKNKNSGLFIDLAFGDEADGTNYLQYFEQETDNQMFDFEEISNGVYGIRCRETGKSFDIDGLSLADGANLHQWGTNTDVSHRQFIIVPVDQNYYQLVARHSGKVLEVENGSVTENANIQQFTNSGQDHSLWELIPRSVTGISSEYATNLTLYPNPASGELIVGGEIVNLEIWTLSGDLVIRTDKSRIDISELPKGIYVAHIYGTEIMETAKLIIE